MKLAVITDSSAYLPQAPSPSRRLIYFRHSDLYRWRILCGREESDTRRVLPKMAAS